MDRSDGRFTLVDASNNEIPVPTFDPKIGVYLDAAIIDVNEHMSRMYYIKDYDPGTAGAPPDCWSDNGVAASIGASSVPLLLPPPGPYPPATARAARRHDHASRHRAIARRTGEGLAGSHPSRTASCREDPDPLPSDSPMRRRRPARGGPCR